MFFCEKMLYNFSMSNLSEFSKSYRQEARIYELFSLAEDKPDLIWRYLINEFKNKDVLDVGCGNGKYLRKLNSVCSTAIGLDLAYEQLTLASNDCKVIQANASALPFASERFDSILSCWVLGTILDIERRAVCLNEMRRVCKHGGSIFLVENNVGSAFEDLRGRNPQIDNRTQDYNNWILSQGFFVEKCFHSYFEFQSIKQAREVFYSIWGNKITKPILSEFIEHDIVIFKYIKI